MLGTPGTLIGATGIALAATFAHASLSQPPQTQPPRTSNLSLGQVVAVEGKSDRLAPPVAVSGKSLVTEVELVGTGTSVILRGRDGEVLYQSDPQVGMTIFARNTDLPILTMKARETSPLVQQPMERREGKDEPTVKRQGSAIGCTSPLSSLVKSDASPPPGLCLVMRETGQPYL
ncbi:hypothetical protein AB4072_02285 [Microvirga sp. 2MCAF38]|uniref:hypothetical protein n=1 Tax=Microvirga sp. 2MCAF38 TaxID=3232989 RepID=UPI003F9D3529